MAILPLPKTVILEKDGEDSPPLHPVDVGSWKALGWEEKKIAVPEQELQNVQAGIIDETERNPAPPSSTVAETDSLPVPTETAKSPSPKNK